VSEHNLVPSERIERVILALRGHKIVRDADLAELYEVETRELVRAVKRNLERFPVDFMFQLSKAEFQILRSHFGTSRSWGGRRYRPYAFTEQGVAMLSGLLRSPRAVKVNIAIMRAFVRLRRMLQANANLAQKLAALERKYDGQFRVVFSALQELTPPRRSKRRIGFRTNG
jgi:ORF6N domain